MIKTEYLLHFCHLLGQLLWKTTLFREGDDSKPIDFFSLYFIDEMFEFLVYKTNTYVEQCKKRFLKILSVSKMKTYSGNSRITMQPFHFLWYPLLGKLCFAIGRNKFLPFYTYAMRRHLYQKINMILCIK